MYNIMIVSKKVFEGFRETYTFFCAATRECLTVAVHSLFSLPSTFSCPPTLTRYTLGGGGRLTATPDYSYPTPSSGLFLQLQTQPQTICMQPLGPKRPYQLPHTLIQRGRVYTAVCF